MVAATASSKKWSTVARLGLFFLGDLLGAGICAVLFTNNNQDDSSCLMGDSTSAAHTIIIGPQDTHPYEQPTAELALYSSQRMFSKMPPEYAKTYWMDCSSSSKDTSCLATKRALRAMGWTRSNDKGTARIIHTMSSNAKNGHHHSKSQKTWQRLNRIYNRTAFSRKENFIVGMKAYQNKILQEDNRKPVYFLTDSYRLHHEEDRIALKNALELDNQLLEKQSWRLESYGRNNKKGGHHHYSTTILTPHYYNEKGGEVSPLSKLLDDEPSNNKEHVLLHSLHNGCNNPLEYNYGGDHPKQQQPQNLRVRVFFLVASVDPLLVFYQNGFGLIGYYNNESSNTTTHDNDDDVITDDDNSMLEWSALENYLQNHWHNNKSQQTLQESISISNPVQHVENQCKESIAMVVDAFREQSFKVQHPNKNNQATIEDGYEIFAVDFSLDEELLQVTLMDIIVSGGRKPNYGTTSAPSSLLFGVEDSYAAIQKNHEIWLGMLMVLEEVWHKQSMGQNLLPLKHTGKWELVVAGDDWRYTYDDFVPTTQERSSRFCNHHEGRKKTTHYKSRTNDRIRRPSRLRGGDDTKTIMLYD